MSHERTVVDGEPEEAEQERQDAGEPERVPENVLEGIRDVHEGSTADVDELIEASQSNPE